jgi:hypothetical protein
METNLEEYRKRQRWISLIFDIPPSRIRENEVKESWGGVSQ